MINGGIKPRKLPRDERVPVTVFLSGGVQTSDGSPIPRVNWIRLELAWRGAMNTHGLPVCPRERLTSTTTKQALERCGDSLVGRGKLSAQIFVPNQPAFHVKANLLTFNGRTKEGRPAVWAHAYSMDPPTSFVIPFTVRNEKHRTVLVTTIRRSVGPWPHVASFAVQGLADLQPCRRREELSQRLLPGAEGILGRFPLVRPRHLQLRRRREDRDRVGAQLPRSLIRSDRDIVVRRRLEFLCPIRRRFFP